jgi:hypothetical protein
MTLSGSVYRTVSVIFQPTQYNAGACTLFVLLLCDCSAHTAQKGWAVCSSSEWTCNLECSLKPNPTFDTFGDCIHHTKALQDCYIALAHDQVDLTCRCFNDGFPNVFIRNALDIRNRNVAFLASFHEPSLIFEQISVVYAITRLFIGSFTLVLPFFPTGTQERVRPKKACCLVYILQFILAHLHMHEMV